MPFLNHLAAWADRDPDRIAVRVAREALSYAQLADRIGARAAQLPEQGYRILDGENSLEFVLNYAASVLGQRRCVILDASLGAVERAAVQAELNRLWGAPARPLHAHSKPNRAAPERLWDGAPESIFLVALTSGTTDLPKALARTRASWTASFHASMPRFGLQETDVSFVPGPLSSGLGLYALSESLYAGATLLAQERFDLGQALDCIEYDGVTRLVLVPALLRRLAERGLAAGADGAGLRSIVVAGAKLDARTHEAARRWAPEAVIHEYFGAQELSFVASRTLGAGQADTDPASAVGEPFDSVKISVVDDSGTAVPDGTPGRIVVQSPMVAEGYLWDNTHAPGQLERVGTGTTVGDEGFLDQGVLHFLGRRADRVSMAGMIIYPQEIEVALADIPGVDTAVVLGLDEPLAGQRLVACIRRAHSALSVAAIRSQLAMVLELQKIPVDYFELLELPLTHRGKLSRSKLSAWLATNDPRVPRLS